LTKLKKYYKKDWTLEKFVPKLVRQAGIEAISVFLNGIKTKGRVPPKTLLVLGDNRIYSRDSRHRSIGFIPKGLVYGRMLYNFKNSDARKKQN
jgi:hypothetical protein